MDNLNELKAIWQTADTSDLPQAKEIKSISKNYQQKTLVKKAWMAVITLLLSAVFVVSIFFYQSAQLSTRLGQIFILIALAILIWSNFKSLNRIYKIRNCSNQEFINYLREVQLNRIIYYKRTQVLGMAFYAIGLLLYLYELVYKNLYLAIILYFLTVLALLGGWFYLRPKTYLRRKEKFEPFLNHIEKLNDQLKAS